MTNIVTIDNPLERVVGGLMRPASARVCTRCVMDTSDPGLKFDNQGVCNHCHDYGEFARSVTRSGECGLKELEVLAAKIKQDGAGKRYDCVIGVSGGVDSTYVAYRVKQLGLRSLAVHLDNGWNSEIAVGNISVTLKNRRGFWCTKTKERSP